MKKKLIVGILIIIIVLVVVNLINSNHISEERHYSGNSNNWSVEVNILKVGESYEQTTVIEYIGNQKIADQISWEFDGNWYGTGGKQKLYDKKITKKDLLSDVKLKFDEQYTIIIEWNTDNKENIILSLKDND